MKVHITRNTWLTPFVVALFFTCLMFGSAAWLQLMHQLTTLKWWPIWRMEDMTAFWAVEHTLNFVGYSVLAVALFFLALLLIHGLADLLENGIHLLLVKLGWAKPRSRSYFQTKNGGFRAGISHDHEHQAGDTQPLHLSIVPFPPENC